MSKLSKRKLASAASPEKRTLPYGFHLIEDDDVAAVDAALQPDLALGLIDDADRVAVLDAVRSNLLTSGPRVEAFEKAFAKALGAEHAVACTNGTSALHLALAGLDVGEGDVCIVPSITFLSTATAARFCGAEVVFADVDPVSGLMTPETLLEALDRAGPKAKAVLPVHLAGRACDIDPIAALCESRDLRLVEDACHAMGTTTPGDQVGNCRTSDAAAFSCHPVKMIACGEGGMTTTNSAALADRMRRLRNHGVTRDVGLMTDRALSFDEDGQANPWSYEQLELGFNYRMTEMAGALGLSQLSKLAAFKARRLALSARYDHLLAPLSHSITPVATPAGQSPALHLYVVHLAPHLARDRTRIVKRLIEKGVGTQVHYIPVYRQPYFTARYGPMTLPGAEAYYSSALALPLFPAMRDTDVDRVVLDLVSVLGA